MPEKINPHFGAEIQKLRLQQNLPLRKVAAVLDIDTSTLSKIEKGERQVQLRMLPAISKLFRLDFKALQIDFLSDKLVSDLGDQEFFLESMELAIKKIKNKQK